MARSVLVFLVALLGLLASCTVPDQTTAPTTRETVTVTVPACIMIEGKADRRCDPGAVNPDVTQETIHQTICVPGWSDRVRPPTTITTPKKLIDMRLYGLDPFADPKLGHMTHREDHLIAITLGGARLDDKNLWPQPFQPYSVAKDNETRRLRKQVCAGEITLAEAQRIIIEHWTHN